MSERSALVLTASDRSAAGEREDASGAGIAERLEGLGFRVERGVVPMTAGDQALSPLHSPRSPRPAAPPDAARRGAWATLAVIDYEVPGLAEAMRAAGRASTPMADLSRSVAGVRGGSLIVNLPGSPKAALESLEAIVPVLDHAMETLAGPFDHTARAPGPPSPGGGDPIGDPHAAVEPDEHE